jgi:Zn-finger nucleic acid-binding protein
MNCLNCKEEMMNISVQRKKDQISYDICEACGSLWLDEGELNKMAFKVEGNIEYSSKYKVKKVSHTRKECPRCEGQKLDRANFIGYSDIILDLCGNCGGFWLDGGELDLVNKELTAIMPVKGEGFSEFVNNVHIPYWHKRIRRKSTETDFKVDIPPIKDAEMKSVTDYNCPACEENLNLYKIYRTEIEGCPTCKGIWLDSHEMRILKDRCEKGSWKTLRWMDDEIEAIEKTNAMPSKRSCPKCKGEELVSTSFGDSRIIIDWCPSCRGTWLDRDEFQEIIRDLKAKLDQMTSDTMKKEVYEEIKEIWDGPENILSEVLDAKAAISALINITIFEHPNLVNSLLRFSF